MNARQYAVNFYGPFGGSIDRWRTLGNQDYDLRATQQLGGGTITVEGFVDAYNYNEQKGPGVAIATVYGPGPDFPQPLQQSRLSDQRRIRLVEERSRRSATRGCIRRTRTDPFPYTLAGRHDVQHLRHQPAARSRRRQATSCAIRGRPTTSSPAFGSFWLQRSLDTSSTHFDPRVSIVYRPDSSDVIRLTGGRSYSEPDPSLLAFTPPIYGAPSSINCPSATSGTGRARLDRVGRESRRCSRRPPTISKLPTATVSTQRRTFRPTSISRGRVKRSSTASSRSSAFPGYIVPSNYIDKALARLNSCPGLNPTITILAFSTTFNAAAARYRGIVLSTNVGLMPRRHAQRDLRHPIGGLSRRSARHPHRQYQPARRRPDLRHSAAPRHGGPRVSG